MACSAQGSGSRRISSRSRHRTAGGGDLFSIWRPRHFGNRSCPNRLVGAAAVNSFRWSGLGTHFGSVGLSTLAANSARNYATRRIFSYGSLARNPSLLNRTSGIDIVIPNARDIRGRVIGRAVDRITPSRADVQEEPSRPPRSGPAGGKTLRSPASPQTHR